MPETPKTEPPADIRDDELDDVRGGALSYSSVQTRVSSPDLKGDGVRMPGVRVPGVRVPGVRQPGIRKRGVRN